MSLLFKFGGMTLFFVLVLTIKNDVMIYPLIQFHEPNKKKMSEKMMDLLNPQTKHHIKGYSGTKGVFVWYYNLPDYIIQQFLN